MASRPNILWIVTTQWRAQALGYAGDANARTPHLDRLAAASVNYAQAVTPHPFGPFARAALLTGQRSPANGVRDYFDPLPPGARTIAHELRDRGYATSFLGKWHLAARDRQAPLVGEAHAKTIVPPESRGGFDSWEGFEGGFQLNDPWLHGTALGQPTQFRGYQADVLADRFRAQALARLATTKPWFAVLSLETPHPPYDAPAGDISPKSPDTIQLSPNVPASAASKARSELAGYYAHIAATDRAIGKVLATLDESGLARETIVVFTSVHGDMHGAHGLFRKGWPHEESVRVPLLVRVPGMPPRRADAAFSLLDLHAETLAWAEGRDVQSAAAKRPDFAILSMPSVVALPHQCDRVWRGVRSPSRKLVLNADGTPWLFFDLQNDPGERNNLVSDVSRSGELNALRPLVPLE